MNNRQIFRLSVEKIQQDCLFVLSWGKGQQVKDILPYPETLSKSYQTWQRAYTKYYQTALRGRVAEEGSLNPINPHTQLVKAQARLLNEFNAWLRSEKLWEIRSEIARLVRQVSIANSISIIDIFVTCQPLELEKLPWETWELEIASSIPIRIARTPANIRSENQSFRNRLHREKARILGIFGDSTGLDFQDDHKALRSLSSLAEIKIVSWEESKTIAQFKTEMGQAITDRQGWDILLFAGHSQDTELTGGELGIAPRTVISIQEIEPQLKQAIARGLQFALFNSCSGISIANSLIDWGLSQVAIMREPIRNDVAQAFLIKFLEVLGNYQDVFTAIGEACQFLKKEKNLDYPSAYLIPSLVCHPEAKLFQIRPFGWKSRLEKWLPNRQQGMVLGSVILLSLVPPIKDLLLDGRTGVQAVYRDLTQQIPPSTKLPVLLVEIDEKSLAAEPNIQRYPLDRSYLARLIDQITSTNAKVIGIDYFLDLPQKPNDNNLANSIEKAISEKGVFFVFGTGKDGSVEIKLLPNLVDLNQSMQGSITGSIYYLPSFDNCDLTCPFSYILAVISALEENSFVGANLILNKSNLRQQILNALKQKNINNDLLLFLKQVKINPLTQYSEYFWQSWLVPINDFSLPPNRIYESISAVDLLEKPPDINQQIVLIAAGGYREAGIDGEKDYFPTPLGVAFWREVYDLKKDVLTGGEAHAYSIHHWLTRHLIIPIPDLWMIGLAALLGKGMALKIPQPQKRWLWGWIFTTTYSFLSLQTYISGGILLPCLLPAIAFWIYLLPRGESTDEK